MRDGAHFPPRFVLAVVAALAIGTACGLIVTLTLAIGLFY